VKYISTFPNLNKEEVDKVIAEYEKKNGNKLKDFSIKEIVLMFHKDTKKSIEKSYEKMNAVVKKVDDHILWSAKNKEEGYSVLYKIQQKNDKALSDHDKIMQHIIDVLPEKGFCEKVTNTLYPDAPEIQLDKKVELLWHDRRWIKNLLYTTMVLITAFGGGNILLAIFG